MNKRDLRTVTKKELVDQIADRNGLSRTKSQAVVQDVLDTIIGVLSEGHRLELRDFGVFEVKTLAPRTAQNPRTLERVPVPERRSVRFKAGKGMRERIEKGPAGSTGSTAPLPEPKTGLPGAAADLAEYTAGGASASVPHHNGKVSH